MASSSKRGPQDEGRREGEAEPQGGPINRLRAMLDERLALPHEKADDDLPANGESVPSAEHGPSPVDGGDEEADDGEACRGGESGAVVVHGGPPMGSLGRTRWGR